MSTQPSPPPTDESPGDDSAGRRASCSADRERKGSPPVPETALIPRSTSVGDEWAGGSTLDQKELEELIRAACEAQTPHGKRVGAGGETATAPGHTPHPSLRRGTRLEGGQLCILEALDAGGMGEVYLAWHETLNDEVVIKVSQAPAMEARFRHEIELQNKLGAHPQIVAVKTAGRFEGRYYLMMEYVPGVDLGRYVKDHGPLPWREACAYARQVALGLAHAHDRGAVHRDIKPRNLIRVEADGSIKILDWGLALWLDQMSPDEDARLTLPGSILGTPDYIAPEQISSPATVGPASDLYSLGCTLYELMTGHPPFHDHPNKLMAHLESPIPALPPELGVPPGVERVLRRLLAKRAKDRYGSARELVEALDAALKDPDPSDARPWWRRHAALAAAIAATLLLVAGVALVPASSRWGLPQFFRWNDEPSHEALSKARLTSSLPPLKGSIDLVVYESASLDPDKFKPGDQARQKLQLHERRALPLGPHDWVRVEAVLNRPAYLYVVWIDTDGKVTPLWPWQEKDWDRRPASEVLRDRLTLPDPESDTDIMPLDEGPPGVETLLLLARETPLSPEENSAVEQILTRPLPRRLVSRDETGFAVWLENGERVTDEPDRAPIVAKAGSSGDPEAQVRQLMTRLRAVFPYTRAVCFGNRGSR